MRHPGHQGGAGGAHLAQPLAPGCGRRRVGGERAQIRQQQHAVEAPGQGGRRQVAAAALGRPAVHRADLQALAAALGQQQIEQLAEITLVGGHALGPVPDHQQPARPGAAASPRPALRPLAPRQVLHQARPVQAPVLRLRQRGAQRRPQGLRRHQGLQRRPAAALRQAVCRLQGFRWQRLGRGGRCVLRLAVHQQRPVHAQGRPPGRGCRRCGGRRAGRLGRGRCVAAGQAQRSQRWRRLGGAVGLEIGRLGQRRLGRRAQVAGAAPGAQQVSAVDEGAWHAGAVGSGRAGLGVARGGLVEGAALAE